MTGYPIRIPPLSIYRGDTFSQAFVLSTDGVVRNLATEGWTDWAAVWRTSIDSTEQVQLVVNTTEITVGRVVISATAESTAAMSQSGVWDLQAVADGVVRTWLVGRTLFTKGVTRG